MFLSTLNGNRPLFKYSRPDLTYLGKLAERAQGVTYDSKKIHPRFSVASAMLIELLSQQTETRSDVIEVKRMMAEVLLEINKRMKA